MKPSEDVIGQGKSIRVAYTVWCGDEVMESTEGRPPLYYKHGDSRVLPAFQRNLEGLKEGDEAEFTLEPAEAYGPYRPEAVQEVPKSEMPDCELKAGQVLQDTLPDGSLKIGRVQEIREQSVIMNFNHPMAGKILRYKVKVISVMSGADLSAFLPKMRFEKETPEKES